MLYNTDFAVAGLVILIILYIFIKSLYNQQIATIIQLRRLILCLILADSFDIISAVTISFPHSVPLWLNYLLNIIFFEFEVICISIFPQYIKAIKNNQQKHFLNKINYGLVIVYAVICASTPFTHSIFYFDEEIKYQHGYLYVLIFIIPLYFLIYSLVSMLLNRKAFNRRQYITGIGFIICAILGPFLQFLLPGNRIIDFFALSVAAFLAVLGLETPDFLKLESTLKELEENKRLLEETRKVEEERNKVIHEMTKSASWSIHMDENQNVIDSFWSDEFFWMLGYERSEVATHQNLWSESLHPDDAARSTEAFLRGLKGIEAYNITYRLRNKKGEYRWYRGTGELRADEKNHTSAYHGIIQDINDEKIKDDLMKEKIAALDELEKSQRALKIAVQKAESADKAKSDFLANMSHEIRTPINAVLGMNELIARESTESQIQSYSANIADAGNSLLSLINDILDFSKIEAGKMEITPANYELAVLIREVHNIMSIRFVDKGLDFKIQCNLDIPNLLYGDEVRIRQIIINLLNNAVKYTDKGSVTLDINYEKNSNDSIVLILSSIDTGVGIKEDDLATLFSAFTRIDLEHNRHKEGTGLGLSITQSFVELMGGVIDVQSKYGEGSTFTVRIPQLVKDSERIGNLDISHPEEKQEKYVAPFTAPDARILIVDDVPLNLRVVRGLLKQSLVQVDLADSGKKCIDKMKAKQYDIVLLDHMMPDLDGIETLKLLQADTSHKNQNTPIIMLTANAIMGAKEEYIALGFTDYLSKPIAPKELDAMLIKYLPIEKVNIVS